MSRGWRWKCSKVKLFYVDNTLIEQRNFAVRRKLDRREWFYVWWQASHPFLYIATIIPLFLGFIVAFEDTGVWNWFIFSGVLLACFGLHLNANLANGFWSPARH